MPLAINATTLHPSTRLALSALEWLEERASPQTLLEIGCGNGILALTAHHLWQPRILACDISENAVKDAQANAAAYAPEADLHLLRSDGLKHPHIRAHAPYDMVIANLLAQWQVEMASGLQKLLAPSAWVVFSGILLWQAEGVEAALKSANIIKIQDFRETEWLALVARHQPAKSL